MRRFDYIPRAIFGVELSLDDESMSAKLPRMYANEFDLLRAHLGKPVDKSFIIVGCKDNLDLKPTIKATEHLKDVSGLPCVICSPELTFWQKEALSSKGVSFIQDARNMFLPFLGTMIYQAPEIRQPRTLSPQAQRVFSNLLNRKWLNASAGDLARRMGKSPSSVTRYLAEIAAISPSLVETDGRKRILRNPGFSNEEILDRFEPYLTSPVKRGFRIKQAEDVTCFEESGFLLAGMSALELKTDLAFNREELTFAATAENMERLQKKNPEALEELPWWDEEGMTILELSYPIDYPDGASGQAVGLALMDELPLYLSLKDLQTDNIRVQDALEQLRKAIWQ